MRILFFTIFLIVSCSQEEKVTDKNLIVFEDQKIIFDADLTNNDTEIIRTLGSGRVILKKIELPETKNKLDLLNYDFLHKRNLLFGTPEYVVNKINELKSELNLQNLQVWSNFPGIDHKTCMRSIKLFNDEVMPKINFDKDDIEKAS